MVAFIHKLHLNNVEKTDNIQMSSTYLARFKELIYVIGSLWCSDTKELLGHALFCYVCVIVLLQYSFSNSGVSTIQILFWRQSLYIIVYDLIKNIVKN